MQGLGQGLEGFRRGDMVEIQGPAGSGMPPFALVRHALLVISLSSHSLPVVISSPFLRCTDVEMPLLLSAHVRAGKTEVLSFLILTHALPYQTTFYPRSSSTHREFETPLLLGGHCQSVLVFTVDTSGFSLVRLAALLRAHISTKYALASSQKWGELYAPAQRDAWVGVRIQIEAIVQKTLGRVRVCAIGGGDSWTLAAALGRVEQVVMEEFDDDEELGLVCVDGFGSGAWSDTIAALAKTRHASSVGLQDALASSPMYHVLDALTAIRQLFSPLVILTTQLLPLPAGRTTHLPYPYTHPFPASRKSTAEAPVYLRPAPDGILPITHLVTLHPTRPDSVSTQRGLSAALWDEEKRKESSGRLLLTGTLKIVGDGGRESAWEGKISAKGKMA